MNHPISFLPTLAETIAYKAHAGQTRRDGKTPYMAHVAAVAASMAPEDTEGQAVAWLHDVLEDTEETEETLHHAGIPHTVIQAVALLTKAAGEDYQAYLAEIKDSYLATRVKLADMRHNLSDKPSRKARARYEAGIAYLSAPSE